MVVDGCQGQPIVGPCAGDELRDACTDREPAVAERPERPFGSLKLASEPVRIRWVAALPCEQNAARAEQGQRQLDEVRERRDRPRRDGGPAAALARVSGQRLGPDRERADPVREPQGVDGSVEEADLLRDGLDEDLPVDAERRGERQTRIAAAAAEVDEAVGAALPQDRDRDDAVRDMPDRDGGRIADRGQVDRRVPGEQEPDVVVDRTAGGFGQLEPEGAEAGVQGVVVCRWKRSEGVDARRERVRRTVQAPLLSVVPVRAVRGPLPASSYVTPRSIPVFRCRSGSRPGFPEPLAGLGAQAVGADAGR